MTSAESRDLLCEVIELLTPEVVADPSHHLMSRQEPSWLHHGFLAMNLMRFDPVEPRTFGGEPTRNKLDPWLPFAPGVPRAAVVLTNPGFHLASDPAWEALSGDHDDTLLPS
jgi:hypothetical protein